MGPFNSDQDETSAMIMLNPNLNSQNYQIPGKGSTVIVSQGKPNRQMLLLENNTTEEVQMMNQFKGPDQIHSGSLTGHKHNRSLVHQKAPAMTSSVQNKFDQKVIQNVSDYRGLPSDDQLAQMVQRERFQSTQMIPMKQSKINGKIIGGQLILPSNNTMRLAGPQGLGQKNLQIQSEGPLNMSLNDQVDSYSQMQLHHRIYSDDAALLKDNIQRGSNSTSNVGAHQNKGYQINSNINLSTIEQQALAKVYVQQHKNNSSMASAANLYVNKKPTANQNIISNRKILPNSSSQQNNLVNNNLISKSAITSQQSSANQNQSQSTLHSQSKSGRQPINNQNNRNASLENRYSKSGTVQSLQSSIAIPDKFMKMNQQNFINQEDIIYQSQGQHYSNNSISGTVIIDKKGTRFAQDSKGIIPQKQSAVQQAQLIKQLANQHSSAMNQSASALLVSQTAAAAGHYEQLGGYYTQQMGNQPVYGSIHNLARTLGHSKPNHLSHSQHQIPGMVTEKIVGKRGNSQAVLLKEESHHELDYERMSKGGHKKSKSDYAQGKSKSAGVQAMIAQQQKQTTMQPHRKTKSSMAEKVGVASEALIANKYFQQQEKAYVKYTIDSVKGGESYGKQYEPSKTKGRQNSQKSIRSSGSAKSHHKNRQTSFDGSQIEDKSMQYLKNKTNSFSQSQSDQNEGQQDQTHKRQTSYQQKAQNVLQKEAGLKKKLLPQGNIIIQQNNQQVISQRKVQNDMNINLAQAQTASRRTQSLLKGDLQNNSLIFIDQNQQQKANNQDYSSQIDRRSISPDVFKKQHQFDKNHENNSYIQNQVQQISQKRLNKGIQQESAESYASGLADKGLSFPNQMSFEDGGTGGGKIKKTKVGDEISNYQSEGKSLQMKKFSQIDDSAFEVDFGQISVANPYGKTTNKKAINNDEEDSQESLNLDLTYLNINQEALAMGKEPITRIAEMIETIFGAGDSFAQYQFSPRTKEIINISQMIRKSFMETNAPPKTSANFYRAGKMLGKGAFGKVCLGMHKACRKLVALKSINKEFMSDDKQKLKIKHEVNILLRLRHRSVVQLYETFETKRHMILAMELCAGGDLLNYVRKRKKLDEPVAKVLFKQILEGLQYIHKKRILHRDIKLDNILLDGKGKVKIADFGVSKLVNPGDIMHEQSGTPAYIAPEILQEHGYSGFQADIWSAGVVLFAMLSGTVPFKASNMKDLHKMIIKGKYNLKEEVSKEAKQLIRLMLEPNPQKRITISQILKHDWILSIDPSTEIFNEEEIAVVKREYLYNNPTFKNRSENMNPAQEPFDCFTELNLDSVNEIVRNVSEKSLILAPFNSSRSNFDEEEYKGMRAEKIIKRLFDASTKLLDKRGILRFAARCRDQDRQYEINNNGELDNGVYHKFVYSSKGSHNQQESSSLTHQSQISSINDLRPHSSRNQHRSFSQEVTGRASKRRQQQNHDQEDIMERSDTAEETVLDERRIYLISQLGYPVPYVELAIKRNEASYCLAFYYLLGEDQNF